MKYLMLIILSWLYISSYAQVSASKSVLLDELPNTRDATFSPDGKEAYVTLEDYERTRSVIAMVYKKGKKWEYPVITSFSGKYKDQEPFISPDGLTLFFVSDRPLSDSLPPKTDLDIWYVSRTSLTSPWSEPVNIGAPVNTEEDEFYPSVSSNGHLYFTSSRPGGYGNEDIWMSRNEGGQYREPQPLGPAINSEQYEFNAYISADEHLILFSAYGRSDDMGGGDIYYSTKDNNGQWGEAIHLEGSNSPGVDYCAFSDKKQKNYYFTTDRCSTNPSPTRYRDIFGMLKKMEEEKKGTPSVEKAPLRDTYFLEKE